MKYGIYEAKSKNCTTYWYFNLKDNKEAEQHGFRKIAEARTAKEASKIVDKLYR